jgi:hypothetical protein
MNHLQQGNTIFVPKLHWRARVQQQGSNINRSAIIEALRMPGGYSNLSQPTRLYRGNSDVSLGPIKLRIIQD